VASAPADGGAGGAHAGPAVAQAARGRQPLRRPHRDGHL